MPSLSPSRLRCRLLATALFAFSSLTHAAVYDVNTGNDTHDVDLDNASCLDASGKCSLRAAFEQANTSGGNVDINVPAGNYSLAAVGAALNLANPTLNLVVTGAGAATTAFDGAAVTNVLIVANGAHLTMRAVQVKNGFINGNGAGLLVANSGTVVTLDQCAISNNKAIGSAQGGGILVSGGTLTVKRCAISQNQADNGGGGLRVFPQSGPVRIESSTFDANLSLGIGAGGAGIEAQTGITVVNSTFSANTVSSGGTGGALSLRTGMNTLQFVTIAGNPGPAPQLDLGDSTVRAFLSDVVLGGAIGAVNCHAVAGAQLSSQGHNLDSGSSCGFGNSGDLTLVDPLLGPLADNGGPTRTLKPQPGSPLIDAGIAIATITTDQTGAARSQGAQPDIGAVETAPPTLSVSADPAQPEGNSGPTIRSFTVSLSQASATAVTVDYATQDGFATASDFDYVAKSGTLTFLPGGALNQSVQVSVLGDTRPEAAETFQLQLTNPVNATIANASASANILNDDGPAATIAVTTTADTVAADGACSLREAILSANGSAIPAGAGECAPGSTTYNTILFFIQGGNTRIKLASGLPPITAPTAINGYSALGSAPNSDPGSNGDNAAIAIDLDGAGSPGDGLVVAGAALGSDVSGIAIHGFQGDQIVIAAPQTRVRGNFIGVDPRQARNVGVVQHGGVRIDHAGSGRIGDSADVADANLIAGIDGVGIVVRGSYDPGSVQRNFIGVDATWTQALAPPHFGIVLADQADHVLINRNRVLARDIGIDIVASNAIRATSNSVGVDNSGLLTLQPALQAVNIADQDSNGGNIPNPTALDNTATNNRFGTASLAAVGVVQSKALVAGNALVFGNHFDGLGPMVDLGGAGSGALDGPNPSDPLDADGGPNLRLNTPTIDAATIGAGGAIEVALSYDGAANAAVTLFVLSGDGDPTRCQPLGLLGSAMLTTDAFGHGKVMIPGQLSQSASRVSAYATAPGAGDSELAACTPIVATGPALAIHPATRHLGRQSLSSVSPPQTFVISNTGPTNITLGGLASVGPDFVIDVSDCTGGKVLAPGASCSVLVTFKPLAVGLRTGTFSLADGGGTGIGISAGYAGVGDSAYFADGFE